MVGTAKMRSMVGEKNEYINKYSRKGGRGVRPWLLIPKVISLAVFVGGYVTASVLWFSFRFGRAGADPWTVLAVSAVFRWVIVPALFATLLFGVMLLLQHPKVFLRRRWLQVKLLLIFLILPGIHFVARHV